MDMGAKYSKQIPGVLHEPESVVFATLDAGDYSLRIDFLKAQSHILKQPCQSIQLHMAMASLENKNRPIYASNDAYDDSLVLDVKSMLDEDVEKHKFYVMPISGTSKPKDSDSHAY